MASAEQRTRYWARSFLGWPLIESAKPNPTHHQLNSYKQLYPDTRIITQNVDGLHLRAGVEDTIEMHGSLHRVKCMSCSTIYPRTELQEQLSLLNPDWEAAKLNSKNLDIASSNPDGDVNVAKDYTTFKYPSCQKCNGVLKPDVVFFGENIVPKVKEESFSVLENCDSLVVMGSSLTVFSSFRLVKMMHARVPILIINLGTTRGDDLCDLKIEQECSKVIQYFK